MARFVFSYVLYSLDLHTLHLPAQPIGKQTPSGYCSSCILNLMSINWNAAVAIAAII